MNLLSKNRHILLPLLSGFLVAIARLPLGLGMISFVALIPLLLLFQKDYKWKKMIVAAFFYSFGYTTVALHWISIVTFPGFIGIYGLFTFYYFLLFSTIRFFYKYTPRFRYFAFSSLWILFDYFQNYGEFRFPWFDLGYSLADFTILLQPAEIGGVALLSLIIVIINILILNLKIDFKRNFAALLILLILWISSGIIRVNTLETEITDKKIGVIQASIPQTMKWERSFLDSTIEMYKDLSKQAKEDGASIILWPESAWPLYLARQYKYRLIIKSLTHDLDVPIVTGFPHYEFAEEGFHEKYKFYNSASMFYPDGEMGEIYYKNYLVPFGERIPLMDIFPFLWNLHLGQANFEYGEKPVFYEYDNLVFSPQICFEIAFSKQTALMAKNKVDVILNLTNDAWFKKTVGTYQHAVLSKFRAIETRRQIIRCANTGYSLVVSPRGEFIYQTELFDRTYFLGNLEICSVETFFTRYYNWLPKLMFLLMLPLIIMGIFRAKEKRK